MRDKERLAKVGFLGLVGFTILLGFASYHDSGVLFFVGLGGLVIFSYLAVQGFIIREKSRKKGSSGDDQAPVLGPSFYESTQWQEQVRIQALLEPICAAVDQMEQRRKGVHLDALNGLGILAVVASTVAVAVGDDSQIEALLLGGCVGLVLSFVLAVCAFATGVKRHDKKVLGDLVKNLRLLAATLDETSQCLDLSPMGKEVNLAVRSACIRHGLLRPPDEVDLLITTLGDYSCNTRLTVAKALGERGDRRAVEPLIKVLGDILEDVREAAAKALGELGDRRAVDPLIEVLGDDDDEVRAAAAEALVALGEPEYERRIRGDEEDVERAVNPQIEALDDNDDDDDDDDYDYDHGYDDDYDYGHDDDDDDVDDRRAAEMTPMRTALGGDYQHCNCGHDYFRIYKVSGPDHYSDHETDTYDLCICDRCGRLHVRHVSCDHYDMTGDHDRHSGTFYPEDDESFVALLHTELGSESSVRTWLDNTHDDRLCALASSAGTRSEPGPVESELDAERATEPLAEAQGDTDDEIHEAAAVDPGEVDAEPAIEPLVKAPRIRRRRRRRMSRGRRTSDKGTLELLIKDLDDRDWSVRCDAADALGALGDKRAVDPLIKALGDGDEYVRAAAAEALGKLGDERAIEPLIEVLGDGDDIVECALQKLSPQWLELTNPPLRKLLHESKLGDPQADAILARKIKKLLSDLDLQGMLQRHNYRSNKLKRRAVATDLRLIARHCPSKIVHYWQVIRRKVETPHVDSLAQKHMDNDGCGEHSDYDYEGHKDIGIGLEFPAKPPDDAKRDF